MADSWPEDRLTSDAFLGGRLRLFQPKGGYRAGVDPVLLAASVSARAGDTVLDLGCGAGVAGLCVAARVGDVVLAGLERHPGYAALARRNAAVNGIALDVHCGDLAEMPGPLRQHQFTHVIANPPYFDRKASTVAQDQGREAALGEDTPLAAWVDAAARRTAPKGTVTFIHRIERLPDLLAAFDQRLGSLEALPLIPRQGRRARLVLVRGRKGGRAGFKLHDGWVMHAGDVHNADRENYTPATACVLRDAGALRFPG